MTAPPAIDPALARLAACAIALQLFHYLAWAVGAQDSLAPLAALGLVLVFAWTLVRSPAVGGWPIRLVLAALLVIALGTPTRSPDARSLWMFHAHLIALEGDLHAQLDGYAAWSHLDYPVLIPALSASLARALGRWNEIFPKAACVLSLLAPLAAMTAALTRTRLQLAFCILLLLVGGRLLVNGYMDALLAAHFAAAALVGHAFTRSEPGSERRVLGVLLCGLLAALTLIKNEGLVLHGILCVSLLSTARRIDRSFWVLAVVSLLPIAAWKLQLASHGIENDLMRAGMLARLVERVSSGQVWLQIVVGLALRPRVILPCVLFAAAKRATPPSDLMRLILRACSLYAIALVIVYLSTPHDLTWHLDTSADRTVMPIALALVLASCVAIANSTNALATLAAKVTSRR
jgi:hypothetical protein